MAGSDVRLFISSEVQNLKNMICFSFSDHRNLCVSYTFAIDMYSLMIAY